MSLIEPTCCTEDGHCPIDQCQHLKVSGWSNTVPNPDARPRRGLAGALMGPRDEFMTVHGSSRSCTCREVWRTLREAQKAIESQRKQIKHIGELTDKRRLSRIAANNADPELREAAILRLFSLPR